MLGHYAFKPRAPEDFYIYIDIIIMHEHIVWPVRMLNYIATAFLASARIGAPILLNNAAALQVDRIICQTNTVSV